MIRELSVVNAYKDENSGEIIRMYDALKFSRLYRTVPLNDIVTLFMLDRDERESNRPQITEEVLEKLNKIRGKHGR